ncbi:hypothetical protein GCM10010218_15970 [Streptomyces mashuensis]|uniref:Cell envelope-related transcriptional attenuator domain-containing protein n=1 Tax=Streptomyces mashuensis TaxID=33904 RepID=A0A919B1X6_9ACTN|nr:LCP family protein [Streptomyces mashuensis]GHF35490.1 hypothetical protein GCM10010218_15970 [Streptomyces mashuensis]
MNDRTDPYAHDVPTSTGQPLPGPRTAPDAAPDAAPGAASPPDAGGTDDVGDVIDWLKFSASRSERRGERRRRGRHRLIAAAAVLAVALGGGITWYALSGDDGPAPATSHGTGQRDAIVVHLRPTRGTDSSTVLLVDDGTTRRATAVLLPENLAVAGDGGTRTTLGRSVVQAGTGATRDALNTLLGGGITGSWRLDTPYLENLVELVGGITVDADATVPGEGPGDPAAVVRGPGRSLDGRAAVAYATYRAAGEDEDRRLARFGQVLHAVLCKVPEDPGAATGTVEALAQIPDPSLPEERLGAALAHLAARARHGAYATVALPVRADGGLGAGAAGRVHEVLGGTVHEGGDTGR